VRSLHTPGPLRESPGGSAEPHSFKCGGGGSLLRRCCVAPAYPGLSPGTSALNNSAADSDGDARNTPAQQSSRYVAVRHANTVWPGFRPVLRQVRACLSEAAQHNACPQRDKRGGRDKPRPAEHGPMTSIASSCMRCCGQRRDDVAAPPKTFPPLRGASLLSSPPIHLTPCPAAQQSSSVAA
jgi:hypothetical protein